MIGRVVLSGWSFLLLMGGKVVLNGWRYALESGEICFGGWGDMLWRVGRYGVVRL
jgi:hypothetical protein